MTDIRKILNQLAAQEGKLLDTQFLAPCVNGGRVRTRIVRTVYELVTRNLKDFDPKVQDKRRLERALNMGGGELQNFRARDDYWVVEWTSGTGERHSSAIAKNDLTVMSSGICLSGLDKNFDLQSLVGVVENR